MTATPASEQAVLDALAQNHQEWPFTENVDTVNGNPWALAVEAATFIEEWFEHPDHNDVDEAIAHLPVDPENYGYDIAHWHGRKKSPAAMIRAQMLRLTHGWTNHGKLREYLTEQIGTASQFGFGDIPSKATHWRAWNQRLSRAHREVLETIAEVVIDIAREHDLPTPDVVFPVEFDSDDEDDSGRKKSLRKLTIEKTKDVWPKAKPYVRDNWSLKRASNASIDELSWWEAHAFMGSREEMYAESGLNSFTADTTRETVQAGSTHRYQLKKLNVDEIRQYHRETTEELLDHIRSRGLMPRKPTVAIDITKSNPYRKKSSLEGWHRNQRKCDVTEQWITGYTQDDESLEYYFKWASIQLVGTAFSTVLDAVPVYRGMKRATMVDELLKHTTDMVDIDLVLMDREFDHDAVKSVCESHGVHYLNPSRMYASERATCTRLRRANKAVHIEETKTADPDLPNRKRVYLPAQNAELWDSKEDDEDDDDDTEADDDDTDNKSLSEELEEEFQSTVFHGGREKPTSEDQASAGAGDSIQDVIDDIAEDEAKRSLPGSKEDAKEYALFETNHPDVTKYDSNGTELDEVERAHMAHRFIGRYSHRWGIENGFKKIKTFRVRTTSRDHEYRFLNFMFSATLYNVWQLVDLLVKLAVGVDIHEDPIVDANLFLTVAKKHLGIPPPD